MPKRTMPTSFTAGRALNIRGTAFAKGATVSTTVAKSLGARLLVAFVNRGWLKPSAPLYPQTARRVSTPRSTPTFHLSPTEFRNL